MIRSRNGLIVIREPGKFEIVGDPFLVAGSVDRKLFELGGRFDPRLSVDLLDVKGRVMIGAALLDCAPMLSDSSADILNFSFSFALGSMSGYWLMESEGRMTLNISAIAASIFDAREEVFIPLIANSHHVATPPDENLLVLHESIAERVGRYRQEAVAYRNELSDLRLVREELFKKTTFENPGALHDPVDDSFADAVFSLVEASEDLELAAIKEKYKECIEWEGPLLRGLAGRQNGFEFRVYSHDHDRHFHVIHKEKGVDARFSFPEIKLLNYKNARNTISKGVEKDITQFFAVPENFKRLESEFVKREGN